MTEIAAVAAGRWRDLLGPRNLGAAAVLAGGVALYATNEFLTISLMPSAVADIGGRRFYSWVTTVYLVGSVVAATTVSTVLTRWGPRRSYLMALSMFGVGSLGCALAPSMAALLVGRTVQGVAGGLLAGLAYAVINTALPAVLWTKASALVSAMWGVGTLVGPAAGGLFAQYGSWRWAFGVLVVMVAGMAVLVPLSLPAQPGAPASLVHRRIPVWSLLLLGVAALLISVAGVVQDMAMTVGLACAGSVLLAVFLVVDRRVSASVLPPSVFGAGPLKWVYATLGVLMAGTMVDMYVPLFGQRLAHLTPVAAGFLGAGLAVGWTAAEISSASLSRDRIIRRVTAIAPVVMAAGLALNALTQRQDASAGYVAVWALGLLMSGVGVGMAWPHLSAWAMSKVGDPGEGPVAAAAINTVQLMSAALGAAVAGVVVNSIDSGDATAAGAVFTTFAVLVAVGTVAAVRSGRDPHSARRRTRVQ